MQTTRTIGTPYSADCITVTPLGTAAMKIVQGDDIIIVAASSAERLSDALLATAMEIGCGVEVEA